MPAKADQLVLIAAVAENGVIGADGGMPWHLPADLRHFKATTNGHPVIMGRKTFEAVGALPGRDIIVISRDRTWTTPPTPAAQRRRTFTARSLDNAVTIATADGYAGPVFVAGGAQIYRLALDAGARRQVLSEVPGRPNGDTLYPDFDRTAWSVESREHREGFDVVTWVR
ncbi:dihydrofolate reductase [Curtobacterium sp. MCSS17_016]|uniref:dihydrofolate reductase n=1 Tax=Curtobacterium sp. MCSS17_016 TaxID=2175644 RepID=UPI000DA79DC1|nr:dihydrofolate reductase [Curtobacterium sp. MCSS17_016]WIE81100.1 dihydrofolate reductase [Curtobacterium sp. MCSS17_016]